MVQTKYGAKVIFEASIDTNGNNYLVIYGKHINGYFCCIPNWKVGCEMAEPSDTYYNFNKLVEAGIQEAAAKEIAKDISENGCEREHKCFKVRVEDTTDGYVEEFESNCISVVLVDDHADEKGAYRTNNFSAVNCNRDMLVALIMALKSQIKETEKRIFLGFIEHLAPFFAEKKESDE